MKKTAPKDFAFDSVPRHQRLSDKVTGSLIDAIKSGQFPPGTRLPSERELGAQFDVSRTVIREAVRSLIALNLVTVTAGRGVEVSKPTKQKPVSTVRLKVKGYGEIDYAKVHEVRVPIEVQTAALAAQRANADEVADLRRLLNQHQQLLDAGKLVAAGKIDIAFHDRVAELAANPLLLAMYHSLSGVLKEVRIPAIKSRDVAESGLRSHRWLLECIAAGDPDAAKGAMERHLADAAQIWQEAQP